MTLMPISVLMTSYLEPHTVGRAIDACLAQLSPDSELLVISPDEPTIAVIKTYMARDPRVRHILDLQHGKPAALNLGLQQAKHAWVVLTDGDVVISPNALAELAHHMHDERVGAITARPISISPRTTMLGYWSHLLVDGAHATRAKRDAQGAFLLCSGYLFAYRQRLMPIIPEDALAEDAVISHKIAEQGFQIRYAPQAEVYVKYPTTYADWLRQKVRSAGGYAQTYITDSSVEMRSAKLEIRDGTGFALRYPKGLQEWIWTLLLFGARLHLWGLVYWNVRLRKRSLGALWQRVMTTK